MLTLYYFLPKGNAKRIAYSICLRVVKTNSFKAMKSVLLLLEIYLAPIASRASNLVTLFVFLY